MDEDVNELLRKRLQELGRKGGKAGGRKRWENVTPEARSAAMKALVERREAKRRERPEEGDQDA